MVVFHAQSGRQVFVKADVKNQLPLSPVSRSFNLPKFPKLFAPRRRHGRKTVARATERLSGDEYK